MTTLFTNSTTGKKYFNVRELAQEYLPTITTTGERVGRLSTEALQSALRFGRSTPGHIIEAVALMALLSSCGVNPNNCVGAEQCKKADEAAAVSKPTTSGATNGGRYSDVENAAANGSNLPAKK
jgi:hypothetical protein